MVGVYCFGRRCVIHRLLIMAPKARILIPDGKTVKASEVYKKVNFYCNTDNCNAPVLIVSMAKIQHILEASLNLIINFLFVFVMMSRLILINMIKIFLN